MIDGVLIRDAIIDTGSAYSIMNSTLHDRLPSRPSINSFKNSAPDIVAVGDASAKVIGYIDVPRQIAGIEVAHSLLVVSELPFAMLIGMDVLRPHAASLSVCDSTSLKLRNSMCPVCLECRAETKRELRKAPAVVCAVDANRMPILLKLPKLPPLVSLSAPSSLLLPASSPEVIPVLASLQPSRSLPPLIHPPLPPPLRPPLIPQSASTLGPTAAPSRPRPFTPSIASFQSSAKVFEIGRVENLRLFADDEWLPPSVSQSPSLIDLDVTPPPAVSTPMSQRQPTARPQRNVCLPARFASAESSAVSCRHSRVSLPCRCHSRSHTPLTLPSLAFLEPIENPSYLHISRQFGRKHEFSL